MTPDTLAKAFQQHRAGQLDEAQRLYRQVLAAEPGNAEAWHLLGVAAHQRGRNAEAAEHIRRAIELSPAQFMFHMNLATVHGALGCPNDAIASLEEAIRLAPRHALAHNDLGVLLADAGRGDEASACFRRALAIQPDLAPAHNNLGKVLNELGRPQEAIECFREGLRLDPDYAIAYNGLGVALDATGQRDQAMAAYQRAVAIKPDYADAHNNIGQLLAERGETAEALERFDRAGRLQPDLPSVRNNRGMILLARGDFARGWPEYEARLQLPGAPRRPPGSAWQGERLDGRTILIYAEQGLGDLLQFIRYAPLVKARGGRVVVRCGGRLIRILSTCAGIDELVSDDDPWPPYDVHAALLSLPGIFCTDAGSIPADVPYLSTTTELVDAWRQRLSSDGRLLVGISWQGSPTYRGDYRRSIPLAEFAPLAAHRDVRLLSLQKGFGIEQLADAPFEVEDIGSQLDNGEANLLEAAAVIKNVDLVVTCDTALAHLAGALAAPVWVALSRAADWRWQLDRRDTPWYPTMRLYRQQVLGRWRDAFGSMADDLRNRAAADRS
jgi:tetratricopeptide (TPR) repeat protein